jgi:hypothetical protein
MFDIQKSKIDRIIIHRVNAKISDKAVEVEHSNSLYNFGHFELLTLKERIHKAFNSERKAFILHAARFCA